MNSVRRFHNADASAIQTNRIQTSAVVVQRYNYQAFLHHRRHLIARRAEPLRDRPWCSAAWRKIWNCVDSDQNPDPVSWQADGEAEWREHDERAARDAGAAKARKTAANVIVARPPRCNGTP